MNHKTQILALLDAIRPAGRCDDCLAEELGIEPRQTVNRTCRPLRDEGAIARTPGICSRCGKGKLVNLASAPAERLAVSATPALAMADAGSAANHQRVGAISNAHAGRDFEDVAHDYFVRTEGLSLQRSYTLAIGHGGGPSKGHRFDLGSDEPAILVECKSHAWTASGNMPSAKVTVWNEAMYYFHLAPGHYRKVLFVLAARHARQASSLADWYVRTCRHLIPVGVQIIEHDTATGVARRAL